MSLQIFKEEPYTEREAWLYLIEHAAYIPHTWEVDGMSIRLEMGQLVASFRYLAEAWGWKTKNGLAKDRVSRFIDKLGRHGWISTSTDYHVHRDSSKTDLIRKYDKRPTLITINNYSALQRRENKDNRDHKTDDSKESETDVRQTNDEPNQNHTNTKRIKNQNSSLLGASDKGKFLFEEFPQVTAPEEFIKYMPTEWQNYALLKKEWKIEVIESEARLFWERYAGKDMEDRKVRHASLERRSHWKSVWKRWCDQEFRNTHRTRR